MTHVMFSGHRRPAEPAQQDEAAESLDTAEKEFARIATPMEVCSTFSYFWQDRVPWSQSADKTAQAALCSLVLSLVHASAQQHCLAYSCPSRREWCCRWQTCWWKLKLTMYAYLTCHLSATSQSTWYWRQADLTATSKLQHRQLLIRCWKS